MDDKGFSKMQKPQLVSYTIITVVFIVFIGVIMLKISTWWFLAVFLWDWKWVNKLK